jgi:hypothetical protein
MKYFLILTIFLSACSTTVPVKRTFPEADPFMLEPAAALTPLPPDTTELDKLIENATDNYGKYRALVHRYEMWQEWYKKQKENFDQVK